MTYKVTAINRLDVTVYSWHKTLKAAREAAKEERQRKVRKRVFVEKDTKERDNA